MSSCGHQSARVAVAAVCVLVLCTAMPSTVRAARFPLSRRHQPTPNGRELQALEEAPVYGLFNSLAYFYLDVFMGTPPQRFSVIADTGSSLLAVPCANCGVCGRHMNPKFDIAKSSTARYLPCSSSAVRCSTCSNHKCGYTQSYAEGSSLRGVYIEDQLWVGGDSSTTAEGLEYGVKFQFGCHTSENGLFTSQQADGIMGLSRSSLTFIHALQSAHKLEKDEFSMCLTLDGGVFNVGDMDTSLHKAPMQYTPVVGSSSFWTVHLDSVQVEGSTKITDAAANRGQGTIVDSGTSFGYLPASMFSRVRSHISSYCAASGKCMGTLKHVGGETLCYKGPASMLSTFPTLTFFLRGGVQVTLPPEALFIKMDWDQGSYCLAVYDNSGHSGAVIGANTMMFHDVLFDVAGKRVGFAPSDCIMPTAGSQGGTSTDGSDTDTGTDASGTGTDASGTGSDISGTGTAGSDTGDATTGTGTDTGTGAGTDASGSDTGTGSDTDTGSDTSSAGTDTDATTDTTTDGSDSGTGTDASGTGTGGSDTGSDASGTGTGGSDTTSDTGSDTGIATGSGASTGGSGTDGSGTDGSGTGDHTATSGPSTSTTGDMTDSSGSGTTGAATSATTGGSDDTGSSGTGSASDTGSNGTGDASGTGTTSGPSNVGTSTTGGSEGTGSEGTGDVATPSGRDDDGNDDDDDGSQARSKNDFLAGVAAALVGVVVLAMAAACIVHTRRSGVACGPIIIAPRHRFQRLETPAQDIEAQVPGPSPFDSDAPPGSDSDGSEFAPGDSVGSPAHHSADDHGDGHGSASGSEYSHDEDEDDDDDDESEDSRGGTRSPAVAKGDGSCTFVEGRVVSLDDFETEWEQLRDTDMFRARFALDGGDTPLIQLEDALTAVGVQRVVADGLGDIKAFFCANAGRGGSRMLLQATDIGSGEVSIMVKTAGGDGFLESAVREVQNGIEVAGEVLA